MNNSNMDDSNDTIQEKFMYEIEKAIEYGNCNIIRDAIKKYGSLLNKSYIEHAERIYQELIEEKFEELIL